jgi:hypothetical protein
MPRHQMSDRGSATNDTLNKSAADRMGGSQHGAGVITYQQTVPFFPSGAAIGGWLMLNGYLTLTNQLLPRPLAWASLLAGVGYVVTVAGFLLGGYQNPLFFAGGLLTVISYPTWAFWLGRVFVSGDGEVRRAPGI